MAFDSISAARRQPWRYLAMVAALALVSSAASLFAQWAWTAPGYASFIWPGAGISIGVLLKWGVLLWPGSWLGLFAVNLITGAMLYSTVDLQTIGIAAGIATGETVAALLAVALLGRCTTLVDPTRRQSGNFITLGLISLLAGAICSGVGNLTILATGSPGEGPALATMLIWWWSDALGIALFVPIVQSFNAQKLEPQPPAGRVEAVAFTAVVSLIMWLIFLSPALEGRSFTFWVIPIVLWSAFRFGVFGTNLTLVGMTAFVATGAAWGRGPYALYDLPTILLMSQMLIGVILVSAMTLATLVADRTAVQLELTHERDLAAAALDSADLMIIATDERGHIVRINRAALEAARAKETDVLGRPIWQFLLADAATGRLRRAFSLSSGLELPSSLLLRWLPTTGESPRLLALRVKPRGEGGHASGLVVFSGRDITEVDLAQRIIPSNRLSIAQLIDQLPAHVWTTDRDLRITISLGSGSQVGGLTPSNTVGLTMYQVLQTDDDSEPGIANHLKALAGESMSWTGDFDGRTFQVKADPLFDFQGTIVGTIGIAVDITERKMLELERERAFQEVARANRLKDDFLATVSHELRTPLSVIASSVKVLMMRDLPADRGAKVLGALDRNVELLNMLVSDLLDFSRMNAEKLTLNLKAISFGQLVARVGESMREAAERKSVALEIDATIAAEYDTVVADSERLHQVLWNLITNAIKFTDQGGAIHVTAHASATHVDVSVRDSGRGIDPEFLPHVFDRFRQEDSTITREHGGLGLGLAIVRTIVEQHGGSVAVFSQGKGRGSTFFVTLPRVPASPLVQMPQEGGSHTPSGHTPRPSIADSAERC